MYCGGFLEELRVKEPLLNGDSGVSNGVELSSKKGSDSDTVIPYSNAGLFIFSSLTFSWVGPLIAARNKKSLDLEDVPQLDSSDSERGWGQGLFQNLEAGLSPMTSGKIQDNILFGEGEAMDKERYDRVLEACALKEDLEIRQSS
ncbi:ABC transporter C family member 3-like protein [Corchorus olitorius]|uniref:ABC transporter C family member 3-like protein n=1 Tax=Corchorus olitorius TaxID=93759 RepID=A0A1R3H6Y0_9ROSI|nr:ABC transporter C family member 3-like protein [Corchorus olitorius]